MIIEKNLSLRRIISFSGHHLLWLFAGSLTFGLLYRFEIINFSIPWLPVSVIGTAVAFYVGFKNNSSYDRLWEARKIWGAIVNSSRTWGMYVDGFVSNLFTDQKAGEEEIKAVKKRLIYRHIAWLYALRSQLLVSTPWEHINQGFCKNEGTTIPEKYGIGLVKDQVTRRGTKNLSPSEEHDRLVGNVSIHTNYK
ncbi:MAG: bestrophin family ion channel [Saprospiraceae bacterium]